jgi:hypothetical protein
VVQAVTKSKATGISKRFKDYEGDNGAFMRSYHFKLEKDTGPGFLLQHVTRTATVVKTSARSTILSPAEIDTYAGLGGNTTGFQTDSDYYEAFTISSGSQRTESYNTDNRQPDDTFTLARINDNNRVQKNKTAGTVVITGDVTFYPTVKDPDTSYYTSIGLTPGAVATANGLPSSYADPTTNLLFPKASVTEPTFSHKLTITWDSAKTGKRKRGKSKPKLTQVVES